MGMVLFVLGFLGGIVFIVKLLIDIIKRKPKKLDFIGIGVCFVLFIAGAMLPSNRVEDVADNLRDELSIETSEGRETEVLDKEIEEFELTAKAEPEEQAKEMEAEDPYAEMKDYKNIVGKSDKEFKKVTKATPTNVRNDKTGNWRKTSISESIDIEEYALSYSREYMKDKEIHFIINFTRNTTTIIRNNSGLLDIEIREHVKGEEHDANTLASGMSLADYIIYPDGDIEEVK